MPQGLSSVFNNEKKKNGKDFNWLVIRGKDAGKRYLCRTFMELSSQASRRYRSSLELYLMIQISSTKAHSRNFDFAQQPSSP